MQNNPWLTGTIIRGDGRGRGLGFPTANLKLEKEEQCPADGIYAVWAQLAGQTRPAVAHVGPRPTFPGATPTIEIHILDFPDRDLYGQSPKIQFVLKIRDIAHFDTVEALVQAIQKDCNATRKILRELSQHA